MNAYAVVTLDEVWPLDTPVTGVERRDAIEAIFQAVCPYYGECLRVAIETADNQLGANHRFTEDWLNKVAEEAGYLNAEWTEWELSGELPDGIIAPTDNDALKLVIQKGMDLDDELLALSNAEVVDFNEQRLDRRRFFSRDEALPDYAYWRRLKLWSAEETVALSFDKDPRRVNLATLWHCPRSPFAKEFRRRLSEANRAIELGELRKGISRSDLRWLFARMGVEIPASFVIHRLATVDDDIGDEPMRESTKRVLETLILVMAVQKYGYDPSAEDQGHVFQAILDDVKANGLSLAEKSVPNKLNEAWRRFVSRKDLDGKLQETKKRYDEKAVRRLKTRK